MKFLDTLDVMIGGWYKQVPHLPVEGRKWLAGNVWWLALIGVVLGAFAVFPLLFIVLGVGAVATLFLGPIGAIAGGVVLIGAVVSMLFTIVVTALLALAVSPLRAGHMRGWRMVFAVALLTVALGVCAAVLAFDFGSLLASMIAAGIGFYLLYEIKPRFEGKEFAAPPPKSTASSHGDTGVSPTAASVDEKPKHQFDDPSGAAGANDGGGDGGGGGD